MNKDKKDIEDKKKEDYEYLKKINEILKQSSFNEQKKVIKK